MDQRKPYRPLPIGVDSFEKIIEGNYFYVDKTLLIKELLDRKGEVNLFTRPRRFGKTLNMTMLRSFFELQETGERAEKQKQLFDGLAISEAGEPYISQMGQYPVIFLSLKSGKQNTWELAYAALADELQIEYDRHAGLLDSEKLSETDKQRFLRIRDREGRPEDHQKSLQFLSRCLEKAYGRRVIILIDEYDVPLENIWNFLYFTGYLTKVSERREGEAAIVVTLRIPNVEVKYIYETHVRGWFDEKIRVSDLNPLYAATLAGDTETMEHEIGRMLRESISYLDGKEAFYHGFLAGLYKGIHDGYRVKSNRESGNGRYDVLLISPDVREPAVLIEIKAAAAYPELEKACDRALKQIAERNYEQDLKYEGYGTVRKYGMAFYRKSCLVKQTM